MTSSSSFVIMVNLSQPVYSAAARSPLLPRFRASGSESGIVEDYRTFAGDFKGVLEFVEWLEDVD